MMVDRSGLVHRGRADLEGFKASFACDSARLSAGDIEISFVGLRPGEKLHEELFIGEAVTETIHPQIKMAMERFLPLRELQPKLRKLEAVLEAHDAQGVRAVLTDLLELDFGGGETGLSKAAPTNYATSVSIN